MIKQDILLAKHNFSELKDLPNNTKIRSLLVQYKIKEWYHNTLAFEDCLVKAILKDTI